MPIMPNKHMARTFTLLVVFMLSAGPAWAVQAHGGAEGLVSHQIGHLLFTFGMGYLLYRLSAMRLKGPGWSEFRTFVWLLIAWNVTTFAGHWMNEFVPGEKFVTDHSQTLFFAVESLHDALYYLTCLDHLVLVPSFAFLLLALRKWSLSR